MMTIHHLQCLFPLNIFKLIFFNCFETLKLFAFANKNQCFNFSCIYIDDIDEACILSLFSPQKLEIQWIIKMSVFMP